MVAPSIQRSKAFTASQSEPYGALETAVQHQAANTPLPPSPASSSPESDILSSLFNAPPRIASTPRMSASTASSLAKETLESLGELSASTWPERKVYLPKALVAVTREPAASFYLNGILPKPVYTLANIADTLKDADKRLEFERWVSLADSLKLLVVNYGGADAQARVQGFRTELGDAKGLWDKLESGDGNTGTGIEKVAVLSKLWHERWDETESPALWFARFTFLSDRLSIAYKADALLALDQSDLSVIAAKNASLNNFLLRDMIISFLPTSYADTLASNWTSKTALDEVKTSVQNLWASRTSREEIAGEEARWRTEELKKDNILVPLEDANALSVADLSEPDRATLTALVARLDALPLHNQAFRTSVPTASPALPPPPPAIPQPAAHPSGLLSVLDDDVQTVPRFFRVNIAHDKDAVLSSSNSSDLLAARSTHISLPSKYILDSGETRHFTTKRDHLHNFIAYAVPRKINGALGSGGVALGEGVLQFGFPSGPVHIANVMLVPDLGVNLISMTRLMMAGMRIQNDRTTLTLLDEKNQLVTRLPVASSITIEASQIVPAPPFSSSFHVSEPFRNQSSDRFPCNPEQ
ncbi:hypothetical protein JCM11641_006983 [Rhodosporidiobolus odoratus]